MANKFTPGEWWYSNLSDELISMPYQIKIAKRITGSNEVEANYNKALIEKAPAMYDALLNLTSLCLNSGQTNNRAYSEAIKLIDIIDKNSQL